MTSRAGRTAWRPRTLRWRLALTMAAVMLVSTGILFAVVYVNTGTQVRRQIEQDVRDDVAQLSRAIAGQGTSSTAELVTSARHYVSSQPYDATSTVFFVLVPGHGVISSQPAVFGHHRHRPGETPARQATEEQELAALRTPRLGYTTRRIPDVGQLRILERAVAAGGTRVVVGAGQPLAAVDRAQNGVARAFVLAGAVSIVLALLGAYLAGGRLIAPLRRLTAVAARVDAGDLEPRMAASPAGGEEVRVLADAFNRMLDRLSEAFAGQREFVADASHELRTPLTVIRGQLELLAGDDHPPPEEIRRVEALVQAEIARISRVVDDLLLLAQAEQGDFLRPEPIELESFVSELWDGMSLTAPRRFELGPLPAGTLRADADRLAQALRNLARNAIEHTEPGSGLVRLEVTPVGGGGRLRFTVIDDGPGIPAADRERVFERFQRVEGDLGHERSRAAGGAGLGLAIVQAIADAHGGSVHAAEPDAGRGARIELELPGYRDRS